MKMKLNCDGAKDRAKGCLMGLFVGDAAGATLEFYTGTFNEEVVMRAMRMPGGGRLGVGKGQVTDDSELAIHLLTALTKSVPPQFPVEAIAQEYIKWHKSQPFDMGHTCARAFGFVRDCEDMMNNAKMYNMGSEANGALMRLAPLVVWARNVEDVRTVMDMAKMDSCLSHCNPICQDANAVYACIVYHLLQDHRGSLEKKARKALMSLSKYKHDLHATIKQWVIEALEGHVAPCTVNIGHVKHALQLVVYCLKKKMAFEEGIKWTLMQGGDTDTNAAIVGSVLGALHGYDAIPMWMKEPVLAFDAESPGQGIPRPALYSPRTAMALLELHLEK